MHVSLFYFLHRSFDKFDFGVGFGECFGGVSCAFPAIHALPPSFRTHPRRLWLHNSWRLLLTTLFLFIDKNSVEYFLVYLWFVWYFGEEIHRLSSTYEFFIIGGIVGPELFDVIVYCWLFVYGQFYFLIIKFFLIKFGFFVFINQKLRLILLFFFHSL